MSRVIQATNWKKRMTNKWFSDAGGLMVLDSLPEGVFVTDSQMRINYFSPAAARMTGVKSQDAVGMHCRDILKADICKAECPVKKAFDSGRDILGVDAVATTAEGKKSAILISASRLMSSSGDVAGHVHLFRDIVSIKKKVSDIEDSCNRLAERNVELENTVRSLKATHKQLLRKEKMESIAILTGGIVHDYNNLLSSIIGYASLLKMKIDTGNPLYKYVYTIERSANKAADVTQQLLTFSHGGRCQFNAIHINPVIEQALDVFERTMGKEIQIERFLSDDLEAVRGDSSQIEQAILNICINAREAMPNGGRLTVSTESLSLSDESSDVTEGKKENCVKVSISDTGEGIPGEIQDKIFDPFFSTKGKKTGTGLGLSVVYGIIRNHRGRIRVESKPGKGTIFEIIFPASGSPGKEDRPAAGAPNGQAGMLETRLKGPK